MVKVGTIYPQIELGGDPQALHDYALAVERMGYDHLLMYDHVVGAVHEGREPKLMGPYTDLDPFHDPLVAFGYLAGITRRIELVTGVIILPQRQTVLVAKQATDVDLLSGGRLRLGVGSGWNYVEYQALGEDFHSRGKKLDEQIPYLRRLWSEPVISFEGRFHGIDRGNIVPRPRRRIPIYGGGFVEAAFARAARLADGFIFVMSLGDPLAGWTRVQALLRENGRSVEGFGAQFFMTPSAANPFGHDQLVETAVRLRDAGATDLSIGTMDRGFTTVDQHVDFLAEAREKVLAALR
jgi:probable F420-dependent oxidoreductase